MISGPAGDAPGLQLGPPKLKYDHLSARGKKFIKT